MFFFFLAMPARLLRAVFLSPLLFAFPAGFVETLAGISPMRRIKGIRAPVGVAHACDAIHRPVCAIGKAGGASRPAVRDALERRGSYRGLMRLYQPPFTKDRHEALGPEQLLTARFRAGGMLVPAGN